MKTTLIMFVGMLSLCSITYGYVYSDYDWTTYNGHQYAITKDWSNWTQAEIWAQEVGGHLATINDNAENRWLAEFVTAGNKWHSYGVGWIGLEYKGEGAMDYSTSWEWQNGEPVTFWNPDTVMGLYDGWHMYLHGSDHPGRPYLWNNNPVHDSDPENYLPGIIEIPEPATLSLLALGGLALIRKRK